MNEKLPLTCAPVIPYSYIKSLLHLCNHKNLLSNSFDLKLVYYQCMRRALRHKLQHQSVCIRHHHHITYSFI